MSDRTPPSGTVTFLFTDIESSTWLLQHLGDDYDRVLHEHNRLLREAWAANDGYEVSTEGDAFFVTFDDPGKAIAAAVAGQRALARHEWPFDAAVRVRMGIHRGEARVYGNDYVGLAVHQAARIASAAHGGQVLISEAARADGNDVGFVDLGPHRLKDLAHAIRLFQLAHPDLASEFPPPRTLTVMPNNFQIQTTTFVGRDDDIAGVRDALAESRLVTLTGAGGVGKTRLALQVGAELLGDFPDGAWLVDLAPLSDPELVPEAVADVLGVREQPSRDIGETLADYLLGRRLLIVLDNCEHLIDACAKIVHRLLTSCPDVKVLATSREALNVAGEVGWRLRSLGVPESDDAGIEQMARVEAVRLFVQRASAVRSDFDLTADNAAAVTQICRRLDGLPLAIELAAARVRAMSAQDISARLDDRFRLLTGGSRMALPRQRTLEAAVSWSYELLPDTERLFFDRLSVFAGACTLEAAEQVCSDAELESFEIVDLLTHLVERSLVVVDEAEHGRTRYRMLETLRQFGRERLIDRGETAALRSRHLAWAVAFAQTSPPQTGNLPPPELLAEEDNLRTAIEWADETGDQESALRIAGSAWTGHFEERARLWERLLPPGPDIPADVAGTALFGAGALSFMMGDWARGVGYLHAAVEANTTAGDGPRSALSLLYEGWCTWGLGDPEAARELIERGLAEARSCGSVEAQARALLALTWIETERDLERAEQLAAEAEVVSSGLEVVFELGHVLEVMGFILCLKGEFEQGADVLADAVKLFEQIQRNCGSHVLETSAGWAAMTGRFELGAELLGAAERIREETGDRPRPWEGIVQERWLPRIGEELDAEVFESAKSRGRSLNFEEALAFAQRALRPA